MSAQKGHDDAPRPFARTAARIAAHPAWVGALLAGGVAAVLYARTVTFGFFGDDPSGHFRYIENTTWTQWFTSTPGFFLRPLVFAAYKFLWVILGGYVAPGYHFVPLALHVANTLLLGVLAGILSGRGAYGWLAALLFATFPLSHEAVAGADALAHPLVAFWVLLALLLFEHGRRAGDRRYLWAVYPVVLLAMLTHENGLVIPALIVLLDLLYRPPESAHDLVRRPAWGYFVLPALFLLWWLQVPKDAMAAPRTLDGLARNTLPFLQVIAYPLLPLFRLTADGRAALYALAAATLIITYLAARTLSTVRLWLFGLGWVLFAAAPSVLFLDWDYLHGSPHVYYLASVGSALIWAALPVAVAGLATGPGIRRALAIGAGALLALLLVLPPIPFIQCHLDLFGQATRLVRAAGAQAAVAPAGRELIYANLPAFFISNAEHPQGCPAYYPFVTTGVVVLPPYADLRDFIRVNGGPDRPVRGVTVAEYDAGWPPRYGAALPLSGVRDALKDNEMYAFEIGDWSLRDLSAIWRPAASGVGHALAAFGDNLILEDARYEQRPGALVVTLLWRVRNAPVQPVTAFAHVYGRDGRLLAQHDGAPGQNDAPVNYAPAALWQAGDVIRDVHTIPLAEPLPEDGYAVAVGAYDPATVERLPARAVDGALLADGLYPLER
jgi:hypothetical protein